MEIYVGSEGKGAGTGIHGAGYANSEKLKIWGFGGGGFGEY